MKAHYIRFRFDEYMAAVTGLDTSQLAAFFQVFLIIGSSNDEIDLNDERFCFIKGRKPTRNKKIRELVSKGLVTEENGKIGIPRLLDELRKSRKSMKDSIENGSKGGRPSKENNHIEKGPGLIFENATKNQKPISRIKEPKTMTWHFEASDRTLEKIREVAPGWDKYHLIETYRKWVSDREKPQDPQAAFIGWAKAFTKNKRP